VPSPGKSGNVETVEYYTYAWSLKEHAERHSRPSILEMDMFQPRAADVRMHDVMWDAGARRHEYILHYRSVNAASHSTTIYPMNLLL
jgi:hypothetical protein